MDLDAYSAAHRDEWEELARLAGQRRFTGADADELIERYQAGATQLSAIKTTAGQSVQGDRLSLLLSRARLRFTGADTNVLSRLPAFFGTHLPAALYRIRWLSLAITVLSLTVGMLYAVWAIQHPGVLASVFGSDAERRQYVEHEFVEYYSNYSGGSFASSVWTNNAWIAAQCVAFGIFGVYTPYLLFMNAMNIGYAGALMQQYGQLDTFFLYIAPHGQLELYSIFVAGAAGLRIFWAWIAPGARSRGQALAQDARALFTVAIGLILALLVSGVIEGFVTRLDWPWPVKIGIGTLALAAFLVYQWLIGGRAARAGHTGDLEDFAAGARRLVAG
jgi:uncharacterized membrane protein SpoIIM required for sporulation